MNGLYRKLKILVDPQRRFISLNGKGYYKHLSDEQCLKRLFKAKMGYELDLARLETFCEKLQWLKLHDRKPIYTTLVDKYAVKDYVASVIGEEYIIPTLGVWDCFDDIDFDKLPNRLVLKCTHDSGGSVIVKDKRILDMKETRRKLNKCLKRNYYYVGREWPYKNVRPRILAEKYLDDGTGQLTDYKFYCFHGKPEFCQVITDRYTQEKIVFYNDNWERQPFIGLNPMAVRCESDIRCPDNYGKMLQFAHMLTKDMSFCRIDFYEVNGGLFFGEITLYPFDGFGSFDPPEWNRKLGDLIDIK